MAGKITDLSAIGSIDRAADLLEVVDISAGSSNKVTPNNLLGITGNPVGTTDSQVMTNKTLTAPTISSPVLSGTITGTYTIGGTPTFPSSVATLTGSQTLTNKTLTSPTINTPTITNASISADAITGFSSANSGTIYGVAFTAGTMSGTAISSGTVGNTQLATGVCVQQANTISGAVATGTTLIPFDDTIPQSSEGDQYMSVSITPKATTNTLVIEVIVALSSTVANSLIVAIFQDSSANALASTMTYQATVTAITSVPLAHTMTAGTTSATTFKVRCGQQSAGTMTFNGSGGLRKFGGVTASAIIVREYKV